ncbi:MAG: cation diffusion facilitator family transporter [Fibrobacter sp.]|jgi:cation diffusion facilitator family transporter|nr:cation diffusion facilitator family transporter [Fibrobacter sp.]
MARIKELNNNGAPVRHVTWIGFVINLVLSGAKFAVGYFGGSRALIADAVHSLSDMVTDVAVILGSFVWNTPPDKLHPYGHRRIETIISIGIGLAICVVGVFLAYESVLAIVEGKSSHPEWIVAVTAAVSIAVKEFLFQYTIRKAKRLRSPALVANAWHHRSDAFSSIPVLLAVLFSIIFPQLVFLDSLGAALVSVFIFKSGIDIALPGTKQIIDTGADEALSERLKQIVLSIPGVMSIHGFRTRYVGDDLYVDLHIVVDTQLTLVAAHAIAEKAEKSLLASGDHVVDALVHVDPFDKNKAQTKENE